MAVGSYDREDEVQTLAEKWNGVKWSISASTDILEGADPVDQWLTGISCASTNFCMAVGISELSTAYAFGEIWNGSSWKFSPLPSTLKYPGPQRRVLPLHDILRRSGLPGTCRGQRGPHPRLVWDDLVG